MLLKSLFDGFFVLTARTLAGEAGSRSPWYLQFPAIRAGGYIVQRSWLFNLWICVQH